MVFKEELADKFESDLFRTLKKHARITQKVGKVESPSSEPNTAVDSFMVTLPVVGALSILQEYSTKGNFPFENIASLFEASSLAVSHSTVVVGCFGLAAGLVAYRGIEKIKDHISNVQLAEIQRSVDQKLENDILKIAEKYHLQAESSDINKLSAASSDTSEQRIIVSEVAAEIISRHRRLKP